MAIHLLGKNYLSLIDEEENEKYKGKEQEQMMRNENSTRGNYNKINLFNSFIRDYDKKVGTVEEGLMKSFHNSIVNKARYGIIFKIIPRGRLKSHSVTA